MNAMARVSPVAARVAYDPPDDLPAPPRLPEPAVTAEQILRLPAAVVANFARRFAPTAPQDIPVTFQCGGRDYCIRVGYQGPANSVDNEIKAAIQRVVPSTVYIRGSGGGKAWSGSGVILDLAAIAPGRYFPAGTYAILTNHHVAHGADRLSVTLPNGTVIAAAPLSSMVGNRPVMNERIDGAILLIQSAVTLPTVTLGSASELEMGDTVLTAGHPYGLPKVSVTRGIVSQPAQDTGLGVPVIQVDAAINPGNSGGPLFNLRGEVVGLNTFKFKDGDNLAFAIPTENQLDVLRAMYRTGVAPDTRQPEELTRRDQASSLAAAA